jgi:hypothetical protein
MHQTAVSIARCIPSVPCRPAFIPSLHHNLHRISIFHAPERRMGQFLSRGKRDDAGGSQPEPDLWLVVGLGNPGPRYASTRHNVGFMAIDALGKEADVATDRLQANCAVGRGRLAGSKVLLCKPMTFMNVSGEGVGKLSRYYGEFARIDAIRFRFPASEINCFKSSRKNGGAFARSSLDKQPPGHHKNE